MSLTERRRAAFAGAIVTILLAVPAVVGATPGDLGGSTGPTTASIQLSFDGGPEGSWSALNAVVENLSPDELRGELLLIPDPLPAPGDQRNASYRAPLAVEPGGERVVSVPLVVADASYRAEVRDWAGTVVGTAEAQPIIPTDFDQVGLLSDSPTARAYLGSGSAATFAVSQRFSSAQDFPETATGLLGLEAVVIDDFDSASLGPDQLDALRGYLDLGGGLLVAGGAAGERTAAALPEDLAPLRPTGTATASLAPVANLAATTGDLSVTVATGEVVGARTVLASPEGQPLMVERRHGSGWVVQLAFDPLVDVVGPDPALAVIARDYGLTRAGVGPDVPPVSVIRGTIGDLLANRTGGPSLVDGPREKAASLMPAGLAALAFVALVGPGVYALLRFRGRGGRVWVGAPALALALAGVVWGATQGPLRRPVVDDLVQVQVQAPGGTLQVESRHRLYPGAGSVEMDLGADTAAWVQPRPAVALLEAAPMVGPMAAGQPLGDDDGEEVVHPGQGRVSLERWPLWEERTVHGVATTAAEARLDADLRLDGNRVVGTVTNAGQDPVRHLGLSAPDGTRADLAEEVGSGESLAVDAELARPSPARLDPEPGSEDAVLEVAAEAAPARAGQVDLVGLVQATPDVQLDGASREIASRTVVMATVELTGADGLGAGLGLPRLVCICGGPSVYEVTLPAGLVTQVAAVATSPVADPDPAAVEVYDEAAGTWAALPGAVGAPGRNVLEPGEQAGAVVRLRVKDPGSVVDLQLVNTASSSS